MGSIADWITGHRRAATIALGLALVLAIGASIWTSRSGKKEEEAASALYLAQKALEKDAQALVPPPAPVTAPAAKGAKKPSPSAAPASAEFKVVPVSQAYATSLAQLTAIESRYGSTRAAHEARMQLGGLFLKHGAPAQAQEWFERAIRSANSGFEKAAAYAGLATAFENQGKFKEALEPIDRAVNQGEAALQAELLLQQARLARVSGDAARAKKALQQVITQFPNSEHAQHAETLQAQL